MRQWSSPETAERVLDYLHEHADDEHEAAASYEVIGDTLGISRNTANTAINRLLATDAVSVSRRSGGRLYPTRYRLLRDADADLCRRAPQVAA